MNKVTTWYLEMHSPAGLRESPAAEHLDVVEVVLPQYRFNRFLYQLVGEDWQWRDKLSWSEAQWRAYVERENLRTWVAYAEGTPAGYYELDQAADGSTEIAYFGLAPGFIGKGYGAFLLSHAIKSAWAWPGTKRVWVHTCTLDHPGALKNYQARGMEIYREKTNNQ